MKSGRDMGLTSYEVKRIYQELKHNNFRYAPGFVLCKNTGCRGGWRVNNDNNKIEECPRCKGYGILKK